MFLINGPIRKFVRQQCKCTNSYCINKTEFGEAFEEGDRIKMTITEYIDVCFVCKTPYHVEYDTSNIILIKNIGG